MTDSFQELVDEIERRILEQGSLSKAEILAAWELDGETYSRAKKELLKKVRLDIGPRRTGGFQAKKERGALPHEETERVNDFETAASCI